MNKTYGILAHPVAHSLSPQMQSAAFVERGIDAQFLRFDVQPADLANFLSRVRAEHINGLAVSLPHKEAIIPLLDEITQTARKIGAVNTVFWKENSLMGDNTDAEGFMRAVMEHTAWSREHARSVAVIGAGGAARAIIFALKEKGYEVTIFNRTVSTAKKLAEEFHAFSQPLEGFLAREFSLVVNSTSVGLQTDVSPVSVSSWDGFSGTAFDAIFDPIKTRFLQDAESAGGKIVTGENMLLFQGVRQFQIWTGLSAPEDVMRKTVNNNM